MDVDPARLWSTVAANSDFRKCDDGLRLRRSIARMSRSTGSKPSLSPPDNAAKSSSGLHRQSTALDDLPDPIRQTWIYTYNSLDGMDGGYARAARKCWHLPNKLRRDYRRAAKAIHFHIHLQQTDIQWHPLGSRQNSIASPGRGRRSPPYQACAGTVRTPAPTAEPSPLVYHFISSRPLVKHSTPEREGRQVKQPKAEPRQNDPMNAIFPN
ncbi:hypothetical protein [Ensifer canadensis]